MCKKLLPEKFLCKFPLGQGAFWIGIVLSVVMMICIICTSTQLYNLGQSCQYCKSYSTLNAHGYCMVAIVYSFLMLILSIWFIWGVVEKKSSVVLGYLVASTMWLALVFSLLIVLVGIYGSYVSLGSWLTSLIFGLLAIGVLAYCLVVVLAYWYELKADKETAS